MNRRLRYNPSQMAGFATTTEAEQTPAAQRPRWSLAHRVIFRFTCCYWVLYALPDTGRVSLVQAFPGAQFLIRPYINLWHAICPWVAIHIFHLSGRPVTYFRTGSGDTTLDYMQNLLFLVFAAIACLVWTAFDRRRPDYRALHGWLRLLVRYTLAFTLFSYGFAKVFPLQFVPTTFARLMEPYGSFSPMGVLWSFMGASVPYIIFSGAAEVTGGLLLLFRRTTSLGALVSFAVLSNVVALNYFYDVPVKLYSTNLLLMAVFLLVPDLGRLIDVLILNRVAAPAELLGPNFQGRRARIAARVFCVVFVGYTLVLHLVGGWAGYKQYYGQPKPPLYGLYDVENSNSGWRKVAIQSSQNLAIRMTDDSIQYRATQYSGNTIALNRTDSYTWSRPDADHVLLKGDYGEIRLRKIDLSKILLTNRGFH